MPAVSLVGVLSACQDPVHRVPPERTPMPALRTLSPAEARDLVSLPWTLKSVDADETTVNIEVAGNCRHVKGSQVQTATTTVTIAILGTVDQDCRESDASPSPSVSRRSAVTVSEEAYVRLPEPLGARSLAHAPVT